MQAKKTDNLEVTIEREEDKNIFQIVVLAFEALESVGRSTDAERMRERVFCSDSYAEAKKVIREYVDLRILDEEMGEE